MAEIEKTDKFVSFSVALQVSMMGVKNVLIQCIPSLYDINGTLNILISGFVSVLYLISLIKVWNRYTCNNAKLFALFIAVSILFSILFFPQNTPFMRAYYLRWIVSFFLTAYLVCKLKSLEWLQQYMLKGSYIMTLSGVIYAVVVQMIGHSVTSDWSTYSMSMSNVVMLASMWQLHAYFKNNSLCSFIFALVGVVVIFIYGSRNPMLAIVIYGLILLYDRNRSKRNNATNGTLFLMGVLILALVVWFKPILSGLSMFLGRHGLSSRSLSLLINSDIEDFSTGRGDIHKEIRELIWNEPLFGSGICGDEANVGDLAHSLYLNIFVTYGVIIGTLFLITIIVLCIKALRQAKGLEHQILVMYMCLVFPRGFTGGDMWGSDVFWWLMGLLFMIMSNSIRRKQYAKPGYNW